MRHGSSSPARALAAVAFAAAVTPFAAQASFAGTRQAGAIEVVGNAQNKFEPVDVTARPDADGEITITLVSEGAPHTWENKALGIDSGIVNVGESKTFSFKAPPAGKHRIICSLHESDGMVGSLTVRAGGAQPTQPTQPADPDDSPTAAPSSLPPASASASASVGGGEGQDAPPPGSAEHDPKDPFKHIPGVEGNHMLERIEEERAAQHGAVSGFKFFTFVCIAFLAILGAAVLFSTRSRRPAR